MNALGVFLTVHTANVGAMQVCPSHAAKARFGFFYLFAQQRGGSSQFLVEVSVSLQFSGGFRRSLRFLVYSYLPRFLGGVLE